jgi:AAA domain
MVDPTYAENFQPQAIEDYAREQGLQIVLPAGQFRTVGELRDIPPPRWNVQDWLQENTTAIYWGLPGSFKTTHLIAGWASTGLGCEWYGRAVEQGISLYVPLEDMSGFKARVEAFEEHYQLDLEIDAPWCRWWDGDVDFTPDGIAPLEAKIREMAETYTDLPLRNLTIDPLMKVFGDGSANEDRDMRERILLIEKLRSPYPEATAILSQHCSWAAEHEFGSITQRALTATSIRAKGEGHTSTLELMRQKNASEGETLHFQSVTLGPDGKIVMQPCLAANTTHKLTENETILYGIIEAAGVHGLSTDELNTAKDVKPASVARMLPEPAGGSTRRVRASSIRSGSMKTRKNVGL